MLPILLALSLQAPAAAPAPSVWTQAELERVADEIRVQVEEIRGMRFKSAVAVKLTDKKGFLEYAKRRQADTESPEKLFRDETVAKLLGLIPPGMDYQAELMRILEEQVGGFYDPGSSTFYLMDTFTGGVAKIILAHELTHALDDQHFDLDARIKACGDETDATLALQAVIEGSGTGLMNQWFLKNNRAVSAADLTAAQSLGAEVLAEAPPYLWKPLLAVYLRGDGFLAKSAGMNLLMKAAKRADVERAFESPPRSSEQILHPKKYWEEAQRDEPVGVSIDTAGLGSEWKVAGADTLGELFLGLLTTPRAERKGLDTSNQMALLGLQYTNAAAEGWGGDRLALCVRGEDALLQLVTAWDSAGDADEFAAALGGAEPPIVPFSGQGRSIEAGWVPTATPTHVLVERETAPDGKTPLVVVRVFSIANPAADADEVKRLRLPFRIVAPAQTDAAK